MFGSVTLDIVISLVFIYLLYSLFATVLSEIIATKLALRARNLKEAIDRMLSDEKNETFLHRLRDSLSIMKNPDSKIVKEFYNHPEIKYLGSSGVFKSPSSFKAVSFSKTLLNLLSDDKPLTKEILDAKLKHDFSKKAGVKIRETINAAGKETNGDDSEKASEETNEPEETYFYIDNDTSKYLRIMWAGSNGDIEKFKFLLEGWFDRTMEQATEWYKRKIQLVLLILGFIIAWGFNADTFTIVSKLSVDKDARDKMVSMANAYIQSHPNSVAETAGDTTRSSGTVNDSAAQAKRNNDLRMDSLLDVKNKLQVDIENANNLLGLGAWLPDSLQGIVVSQKDSIYTKHKNTEHHKEYVASKKDTIYTMYTMYSKRYNYTFKKCACETAIDKNGNYTAAISSRDKIGYLFSLLGDHFFGFLITAIAVSLGAPFWFDLLNKLMKLRTSAKQDTDSTEKSGNSVSLDQRVG